ncbi:MAG TPA: CBS domain-containing protein [Gemmatimonadota bacterium]
MTREVVTVGAGATLREAIGILRAENVNGAPAIQNGQVVGVISVSDILDFEVNGPTAPPDSEGDVQWRILEDEESDDVPSFYGGAWDDVGIAERFGIDGAHEWDLLGEHVVGDVMTRGLFSLPPETPLDEAGTYMMRRGIHRVLVMEGKRLLGIASASDFVRAVAEHRV